MVQKFGVLYETQDLPEEGKRLLLQGLRVADVAVDNLPPLFFKLLGTEDDRAPHSIFSG
jgi:hypothetical protein